MPIGRRRLAMARLLPYPSAEAFQANRRYSPCLVRGLRTLLDEHAPQPAARTAPLRGGRARRPESGEQQSAFFAALSPGPIGTAPLSQERRPSASRGRCIGRGPPKSATCRPQSTGSMLVVRKPTASSTHATKSRCRPKEFPSGLYRPTGQFCLVASRSFHVTVRRERGGW